MKRPVWQIKPRPGETVYQARLRRATVVFGIFALIIIPVYTLLFASHASWTDDTLSVIGGAMGHFEGLVFWGFLSAGFFLSFTGYLFRLTRFSDRRVARMLYLACALLVATVLIPFLPESRPRWAEIHNTLAMAAPVLMLVVLYLFVFHLHRLDAHIFKRAVVFLTNTVVISAVILFSIGISSLLEVVFSLSVCVFLFCMLLWLRKSDRIDAAQALADEERRRPEKEEEAGPPAAI